MGIAGSGGGREGNPTARDRYSELAALLRSRREALGISRRDLAASTGLSYPYIAQLEGGYRAPSVTTARRLADALRIPVEEIVHATDEATSTAPTPAGQPLAIRDDAWLANPSYAPGIAAARLDASVPVPAAPTAPLATESPAAAEAPSASPRTAAPPTAAPTPATSPAQPSASTPTRTPAVTSPPPPAALPAMVAPPAAAAPPPTRHGLFGRRREDSPRGPAGGAPPPAAPGPAVDPVATTAEQITTLLRALPASDRLDALAAAQRDVMAQLVEDRIRNASRQSEA